MRCVGLLDGCGGSLGDNTFGDAQCFVDAVAFALRGDFVGIRGFEVVNGVEAFLGGFGVELVSVFFEDGLWGLLVEEAYVGDLGPAALGDARGAEGWAQETEGEAEGCHDGQLMGRGKLEGRREDWR